MKRNPITIFLVWVALLNWPAILIYIPGFQLISFIPFLFWINIPALWLGLARTIGQPHYDIQEFGALPQTPLAWFLIVAFWLLVAAVLTLATSLLLKFMRRNER